MSVLPSFMFSAFPSVNDGRFVGWAAFRDALAVGLPVPGTPDERVGPPARHIEFSRMGIWRLLASNNRELARSWSAYPSFGAAHDHVERLQRDVGSLKICAVRGESPSQYGWLATSNGVAVITSGRWFGASSTALHSAVTSLAAFETAVVPATAARDRTQGRRRSGQPDADPQW